LQHEGGLQFTSERHAKEEPRNVEDNEERDGPSKNTQKRSCNIEALRVTVTQGRRRHRIADACGGLSLSLQARAHNGDMVQNVVFKWKVHMGQLVDQSMPPLKVLCLHGFMQNGGVFRTKTGSFRKVCSPHFAQMWQFIIHFQAFKNCDFIFPDAPHPPSEVVFKQAPGEQAAAAGIKFSAF
jgi:hypothetical protein